MPSATKNKILQVAGELFAQRGYYGVSMEEIADRVGVTKSTLYYHFDSKEHLLRTLLNRSCAKLKQSLNDVVYESDDPLDFLIRLVQVILDYGIANPEIKLLTTLGLSGHSDLPVLQFVIDLRTDLLAFIRDLLSGVNAFRRWTVNFLSLVSMNILSFALNPFVQDTEVVEDPKRLAENFGTILSASFVEQPK